MSTPSAPAKILVGITLNPEDSKELLSWAIRTLTHPNDTLVALHVLGQHCSIYFHFIIFSTNQFVNLSFQTTVLRTISDVCCLNFNGVSMLKLFGSVASPKLFV